MRIIIANYRFFIAGGPEKYMFRFMSAAEKRGVEIIPFSVSNPQNAETPYSSYFARPRAKELMYADTRMTPENIVGMVRATVWNYDAEHRLRKLIRDTHPDAVYILHEINHLSPSIIRTAKKEGIRVVHRISDYFILCPKSDFLCGDEICEACMHGDYSKAISERCVKGSLPGTLLRIFAMRLYRAVKVFNQVDQYICTCKFTRDKMIEGGIPEEKIVFVPSFIDAERITPCYEHDRYFLFLGRMARQKGAIYAIEAMAQLKDTDYVLKITGDLTYSTDDQVIRSYIRENGLEDKIVFTGFLSGVELETLISRSTCVVCPAIWYENMPNTVIEAYAYGKPVVASDVGSLAEIVENGKTGFLFEMKNATDLASKMRTIAEREDLRAEMGRNARKICEEKYAVDKHMEKVLSVLSGEAKDNIN